MKETILQDWIDQYLSELKSDSSYKYVDFEVSSGAGYLYIRAIDVLIPSTYLSNTGCYVFNKEIVLRQSLSILYSYLDKSQKEFNEFLKGSFESPEFIKSLR